MNCDKYRSLLDDAPDTSLNGILECRVRLHPKCRSYDVRQREKPFFFRLPRYMKVAVALALFASFVGEASECEAAQLSAEVENDGVSIPPSGDAVSSMGTGYFELDARAFTCLSTNWSPLRSKPLGTIISIR